MTGRQAKVSAYFPAMLHALLNGAMTFVATVIAGQGVNYASLAAVASAAHTFYAAVGLEPPKKRKRDE